MIKHYSSSFLFLCINSSLLKGWGGLIVIFLILTFFIFDKRNEAKVSGILGHWGGIMVAAAAKSRQSCPTLCDPIDCGPPGSPVPGILQARTVEWGAISFSNAWKWKVKGKSLSRLRPSATPWTADYQAPPSMGFSRQEYWSWMPSSPVMKTRNSKRCSEKVNSHLFILP